MANIFRRFLTSQKQEDILGKLEPRKLESLFRIYYRNDEKIDEIFVQEYEDLTEYTRTHATEVAKQAGGSISSTQVLALLSGLLAQVKINLETKRGDAETEKYRLGTVARFNILRRYWASTNRLHVLDEATPEILAKSQALISCLGNYRFVLSIADLEQQLTQDQIVVLENQQEIEEKIDHQSRVFYFIESTLLAVALLSARFITNSGTTILPHFSGQESNVLFIGGTVGDKQGILFLDPIAIGEDVPTD